MFLYFRAFAALKENFSPRRVAESHERGREDTVSPRVGVPMDTGRGVALDERLPRERRARVDVLTSHPKTSILKTQIAHLKETLRVGRVTRAVETRILECFVTIEVLPKRESARPS